MTMANNKPLQMVPKASEEAAQTAKFLTCIFADFGFMRQQNLARLGNMALMVQEPGALGVGFGGNGFLKTLPFSSRLWCAFRGGDFPLLSGHW